MKRNRMLQMEDEGQEVYVFTYGTLKRPYTIKADGGTDIVENCTISGHKMYDYNSAYPVTTKTGNENDIIYGTLFKLPFNTILYHYDYIEGYIENRNPKENLYNRIIEDVVTPDGKVVKAIFYYANQTMFKDWFVKSVLIESGNYDDVDIVRKRVRELKRRYNQEVANNHKRSKRK